MKPNELRIDNYVEGYNGKVFQWSLFDFATCNNDVDADEIGKPIPLTEEWLLKFGFERMPDYIRKGNGQDWQPDYPRTYNYDYYNGQFVFRYYEWHWMSKQKINIDKSILFYSTGDSYYENISEGLIDVKELNYVHQLQNLYFALTGEELKTIN